MKDLIIFFFVVALFLSMYLLCYQSPRYTYTAKHDTLPRPMTIISSSRSPTVDESPPESPQNENDAEPHVSKSLQCTTFTITGNADQSDDEEVVLQQDSCA